MINFRYHIVSLTAVFLALGIGTLLGSTFLDRYTVDQLDKNIRGAEERIEATEEENRRLEEQLDDSVARDLALIAASEVYFDGMLTDRPVLLVAAPGVEQGTLEAVRIVAENADADLRGTLVLDEDMAFDEVDTDLMERLGIDEARPGPARDEVAGLLVDALEAAGRPGDADDADPSDDDADGTTDPGTTTEPDGTTDPGTTTGPDGTTDPGTTTGPDGTTDPGTTSGPDGTTEPADGTTEPSDPDTGTDEAAESAPDGQRPDVVDALIDAGLMAYEPGPGLGDDAPILEATGYRYVFVGQPDLEPEANEILLSLLPEADAERDLRAVVVSPRPPAGDGADEAEPSVVARVRATPSLAAVYDTVDDIDSFAGLASTVQVLAAPEGAAVGHYGQQEGATALVPAPR